PRDGRSRCRWPSARRWPRSCSPSARRRPQGPDLTRRRRRRRPSITCRVMASGSDRLYIACMAAAIATPKVGELLRGWRQRRNLSQLALAGDSAVSTRYLSFIETGRARPSREMVTHLAEQLEVPLRERNALLMAAGYAPIYGERSLDDSSLEQARGAID